MSHRPCFGEKQRRLCGTAQLDGPHGQRQAARGIAQAPAYVGLGECRAKRTRPLLAGAGEFSEGLPCDGEAPPRAGHGDERTLVGEVAQGGGDGGGLEPGAGKEAAAIGFVGKRRATSHDVENVGQQDALRDGQGQRAAENPLRQARVVGGVKCGVELPNVPCGTAGVAGERVSGGAARTLCGISQRRAEPSGIPASTQGSGGRRIRVRCGGGERGARAFVASPAVRTGKVEGACKHGVEYLARLAHGTRA